MNNQRNHTFKFETPWNDSMDAFVPSWNAEHTAVYAAENTMASYFVYKRRIPLFFYRCIFHQKNTMRGV